MTPARWATVRTVARWLLAGFMGVAGLGHFVFTEEFRAQVPSFLPFPTALIVATGFVEIGFAVALVAWRSRRRQVGWALALYLVLVFPGNVAQAVQGTDLLALDTDVERWARLAAQPLLILWALWCTGAWPRADDGVTT